MTGESATGQTAVIVSRRVMWEPNAPFCAPNLEFLIAYADPDVGMRAYGEIGIPATGRLATHQQCETVARVSVSCRLTINSLWGMLKGVMIRSPRLHRIRICLRQSVRFPQ